MRLKKLTMHADDSTVNFWHSKLTAQPSLRNRSKQPPPQNPPTHIFYSSVMEDRFPSKQSAARHFRYKHRETPYSTADDKAGALSILITPSLDFEFLFE